MIENEISVGNKFIMRVNFNLVNKSKGDKVVDGEYDEKSQIWLTTTINNERARVYTRLRIEPCFWIKRPLRFLTNICYLPCMIQKY